MNTSDIDQRIDDLEMKLQFQEDTIDSLNEVLVRQQKDILLITEKFNVVSKQLESYKQQQTIHEGERPPHY